jgi:hypothetical protein
MAVRGRRISTTPGLLRASRKCRQVSFSLLLILPLENIELLVDVKGWLGVDCVFS